MPQNIILLSDGTGNSASKLFKTNVWRVYQSLDLSETGPADPNRQKQIAFYDDGVGTSSFKPLAILGGAFGWGTKRNVLDLYTFLCRHYRNGDSIYCFGFSRGAFTIRVLTGLIDSEGLVQADTDGERRHLAAEAFRAHRAKHYKGNSFITTFFRFLRWVILSVWYKLSGKKPYTDENNIKEVHLKFLGLWDTVAAYGLPIDELTHAWNFIFPLSFPDRNLSKIVDCAYHALAIDDERLTFHPELWNEKKEDYEEYPDDIPLGDRLNQVWFAGMHSNLGGGYPDDGLSQVSLNWIMDKAELLGLSFSRHERRRFKELASVKGKKYDSRRGLGGAYRYMPRKIDELTHDNEHGKKKGNERKIDRVVIDTPKIHESVFMRIADNVDGYAPIGLPKKYQVVAMDGSIIDPRETPIQSEDRSNREEELWNSVWRKRVVYFLTVFAFIALATFPIYLPVAEACKSRFCFLSPLIGSIGTFLPGFLDAWIKAYQSHPGFFLLIVIILSGLLFLASRLQRKIFDGMRIIFDKPELHNPAALPTDFIYNFRTNKSLKKLSKFWKEKLVPALLLAVIVVVALYGLSRGIFR
ncbi:MAG TPA: DUF2235 domain-containing protein, partial [Blastocatellia bacterium]|nr:DUF2235 domain-containing protein [Blastocatellia bacterium]